MKVIIIEGPDNIGKNTLIHWIIEQYSNVRIIHCGKPTSKVNAFLEQKKTFLQLANDAISDNVKGDADVVVFNRFCQGEYVYGQLYRGGDPDKIIDMVHMVETYLKNNIDDENIFYVQMTCESANLLCGNDDGKSLSNNNREKILQELRLFDDVFANSCLSNKLKLFVNNPNNPNVFRQKKEIIQEFSEFLNAR